MRWWIKSKEEEAERAVVVAVWGGEKRTGEEEEQRILLETGGLRLSSKMEDLFPHTMADMFRSLLLSTLSPSSLSPTPSLSFTESLLFFTSTPPKYTTVQFFFPQYTKTIRACKKLKKW